MSKEKSIAIITPSCRAPSIYYGQSVLGVMLHTAHYGVRGEPVSITVYTENQCSLLSSGRQKLLDICLNLHVANKLTHAVFIDDDMQFDSNIFDDLVQDGKCIGANYLRKEQNTRRVFTAVNKDPHAGMVDSTSKTGLEEVSACGLGMFCMDLKEVLKTDSPHFEVKWEAANNTYVGEDIYFMRKLKAAKVPLYISHEASRKVGHCGEWIYKI